MVTIRKNNKKLLNKAVNDCALLAVFKGDGYYPIAKSLVLEIIASGQFRNAIGHASGRVDIDINDRAIGEYVIAIPSLELAKKTLYHKDYARLNPDS